MSATFLMYAPPPDLASAVEAIWLARGRTLHRREVVLPNGAVELIVNLADPQWVVASALHPQRHYREAFVAGPQRGPLRIEDDGETDLLGVRFRPGGIVPWLRLPLGALTDRIEHAEDLALRWVRELRARLLEAPHDLARSQLAVDALSRNRTFPGVDRRVRDVLTAIGRDPELPNIRSLAARVGVSHKHLDELFHRGVGFGPRTLRRVLRFHSVVDSLRGSPPATVRWAQVAARAGFSDQSHMIREFRAFAGHTPADFLRLRTDDGYHPVDG